MLGLSLILVLDLIVLHFIWTLQVRIIFFLLPNECWIDIF